MIINNATIKRWQYKEFDSWKTADTFAEGAKAIGIPYGWMGENSPAFIEIQKEEKVIATINIDIIGIIDFGGCND